MKQITFARDYRHHRDALTTALYRGGRSYSVAADIEQAARDAGALKEPRRARSGRSARKGSAGLAEG
jgi:hypothetical protein